MFHAIRTCAPDNDKAFACFSHRTYRNSTVPLWLISTICVITYLTTSTARRSASSDLPQSPPRGQFTIEKKSRVLASSGLPPSPPRRQLKIEKNLVCVTIFSRHVIPELPQ